MYRLEYYILYLNIYYYIVLFFIDPPDLMCYGSYILKTAHTLKLSSDIFIYTHFNTKLIRLVEGLLHLMLVFYFHMFETKFA